MDSESERNSIAKTFWNELHTTDPSDISFMHIHKTDVSETLCVKWVRWTHGPWTINGIDAACLQNSACRKCKSKHCYCFNSLFFGDNNLQWCQSRIDYQ